MFRTALATAPRRMFSSTPLARQGEAFADLARITATPSPASAGTSAAAAGVFASPSSAAATATAQLRDPSAQRGYSVGSMPAKGDPMLELFTNLIMRHGKKAEAQRHLANVLGMVQRATNQPPVPLLHRAIELSAPQVRLLSVKKHNKTIQSPRALNERQRARLGIEYLLKAAERGRKSGVHRDDRIAREILAVIEGTSEVFKRLEELHKLAMLNRSNIHVR